MHFGISNCKVDIIRRCLENLSSNWTIKISNDGKNIVHLYRLYCFGKLAGELSKQVFRPTALGMIISASRVAFWKSEKIFFKLSSYSSTRL